ncbi:MAG: metallophosphoesterase family protein, partial [Zestosphaera sp.]
YPFMGSQLMEKVVKEAKPDIVIHAHAHNARVVEASMGNTKIYNVSLPARKGLTQVEIQPRKTLENYRVSK